MEHQHTTDQDLWRLIRSRQIKWAGHKRLKIYGTLHCRSGKRMKRGNRIFFTDEKAALRAGFRPCAHCCRAAYLKWKHDTLHQQPD
ncbi:MAG: metal-binding protein [Chitinophagaceae bacterium]|nr:metal-binding protein [Chitinophagaceae bacterium]